MKTVATVIVSFVCAFVSPSKTSGQVSLHALHEGISGPGDQFGVWASNDGDANGDGFADLAVGVRFYDCFGQYQPGSVFVFSGKTGEVLWARCGSEVSEAFGSALDFIGDIDDDGKDDLVIGAVAAGLDLSGQNPKGRFYVVSGATGANIHTPVTGPAPNAWLGHRVSGGGDVNDDGVPDYVVGAIFADNLGGSPAGFARVYSGATNAVLMTVYGVASGDDTGSSVGIIEDLNGDGFDDVLVGKSQAHAPATSTPGEVIVVSGFDGSVLHTFSGDQNGDAFGVAVSSAGDVNGDLVHDILIGASQETTVPPNHKKGYARVYSGADWTPIATFLGEAEEHEFGMNATSAGDFNGDGLADVMVAAGFADTPAGLDSGRVYVYSVVSGDLLFTCGGDSADDHVSVIAGGGDVNGDGFSDVVVGGPEDDVQGVHSGSAYVYCGLPSGCVNDMASVDADEDGIPDDCEPWTDLRSGLAGVDGMVPKLDGFGFLVGGKPMRIDLADAKPLMLAVLVLGTSQLGASFHGGIMVPNPSSVGGNLITLLTNVHGALSLGTTWPPAIPPGLTLFFQYWITDSAGPAGLSASNGLLGTTP